MIPLTIMEEHHEAYLHWNYYIQKGYLSPQDNYLLHVDHHDDFEAGGYPWNFDHMPKSYAEVYDFTYHVLGIASFIAPAVYQGIFSDVHILKNLIPHPLKSEKQIMQRYGSKGLKHQNYIPFLHGELLKKAESNCHLYEMNTGGLGHTEKEKECLKDKIGEKALVLDIDLDYFVWDDSLSSIPQKLIEITKEAYEEYCANPYHPYRLLPVKILYTTVEEEADGSKRYYLGYEQNFEPKKLPSVDRMKKRVENFIEWLRFMEIKPSAIDICRSRYSGYLPSAVYPWIEEYFLERLSSLYEFHLEEIEEWT